MSFSRSRNKFLQFAKPSTPPREGTTELFFDINNGGAPTVYYPDGTTQSLIPPNITFDGETLVIGTGNSSEIISLSIETISAGATIVPVGNKPIIKVTSDSSSQNNLITMPSGVAGQMLTIINLDEDPIRSSGNVYIPSGEVRQYIYVDSTVGWMPMLNVANLTQQQISSLIAEVTA